MVTKKDLRVLRKHIPLVMGKCKRNHYAHPLEWLTSERLTTSNSEDVVQPEPSYTAGM